MHSPATAERRSSHTSRMTSWGPPPLSKIPQSAPSSAIWPWRESGARRACNGDSSTASRLPVRRSSATFSGRLPGVAYGVGPRALCRRSVRDGDRCLECGRRLAGGHHPPRPSMSGPGLPRLLFNIGSRAGNPGGIVDELGETPEPLMAEVAATSGTTCSRSFRQEGGPGQRFRGVVAGARDRGRPGPFTHSIEPAPSPRIRKNGAVTSAAAWQPAWAVSGAPDVVTQVYLADLHGQIHRLRLLEADNWKWGVAHRLGGEYPILTPPVAFPFPGRAEPHLLVVTGGDRRVRDIPSDIVLLRDTGTTSRRCGARRSPTGTASGKNQRS